MNQFSPSMVPMILVDGYDSYQEGRRCGCFPPGSIDPPDQYSNRPYVLPWDSNWTVEQIRAEEIRRLCWSSLTLISEYVSQCEAFNEPPPHFFLADPANVSRSPCFRKTICLTQFCRFKFGLLFPGEVLDRVSPSYRGDHSLSTKESVWALYCRSMLLWNFCNRFRIPSQEEERAEQAHEAFLEAQSIEDSLTMHRCNLDTTLMYMCREYIHK